jgi:hypothetical protein
VRCQEQESCSILVERTRESKREVELRKETTLLKERTHPKAKRSMDFRQQGRIGRTVRICGGHTACNVHRN